MAKKTHKSTLQARDAILDAAEHIVFDVGTAGLRISAVAQRAGMAHPNIIHHFGSRDGLLHALSKRVATRATERIKKHITLAMQAPPEDRVQAMTAVLESAYPGREGRVAAWLLMSGAKNPLDENIQQIVELSHQLREKIRGEADKRVTSRLVMLVTMALMGEVVIGDNLKQALGYSETGQQHHHANFKQWLAELLLNLSNDDLITSLDVSE